MLTGAEREAIRALRNYYQADEDGIMVVVSRQAIEETLGYVDELRRLLETAVAANKQWKRLHDDIAADYENPNQCLECKAKDDFDGKWHKPTCSAVENCALDDQHFDKKGFPHG